MNKHEIMTEYVRDKINELCKANMTFNFADGEAHSVSFITNFSGRVLRKYIRAADKEYGFTILITWHYSMDTDDLNMQAMNCLLYTSPSPRDRQKSRMPSSA